MNVWSYIPMSISHLALSLVLFRFQCERWRKLLLSRFSLWWRVVEGRRGRRSWGWTDVTREDGRDKACDLQLQSGSRTAIVSCCQTQTKIMDSPQFSNLDFITTTLLPFYLLHIVWKLVLMSHLYFLILAFSTNYWPIKMICLVTLFDRKLEVFKYSPNWTIDFCPLKM